MAAAIKTEYIDYDVLRFCFKRVLKRCFSLQENRLFLVLRSARKQARDCAQCCCAYDAKNNAGQQRCAAAKQPAHQIKLNQSDQTPVDAADNQQSQTDFV